MRNKRLMWTGPALLLAAMGLCADEGYIARAQRKFDFPGTEEVVGKVWFNVQRTTDSHIYVRSLTQPTLGMGRTKGDDNLPLGLVQCVVIKRLSVISPDVVLDTTLARCPGQREYVVDEVLFDVENFEGEKR